MRSEIYCNGSCRMRMGVGDCDVVSISLLTHRTGQGLFCNLQFTLNYYIPSSRYHHASTRKVCESSQESGGI